MRPEDFRGLFHEEAAGRLARMAALVAELATSPGGETVAALFRETHTIKGSAAVVGLSQLAAAAHVLEEGLEGLREGRVAPDAATRDLLLAGVDALTAAVVEAAAGAEPQDAGARVAGALGGLAAAGGAGVGAVAVPRIVELPRIAPLRTPGTAARSPREPPPRDPVAPAAAAHVTAPRPPDSTVRISVERLDVLQRLAGESAAALQRARPGLAASDDDLADLTGTLDELQQQALRTRTVPVGDLAGPLGRAAREAARATGREVAFTLDGGDAELDRDILARLTDPLVQMVRNAVVHGIEDAAERLALGKPGRGAVAVRAWQRGPEVVLEVADDGRGIDLEAVRARAQAAGHGVARLTDEEVAALVFRSGVSTAAAVTGLAGRGVGMDVVRAVLEDVGGRHEVATAPGRGAAIRLVVPLTLAILPCLLCRTAATTVALPVHAVRRVLPAAGAEGERRVEGRAVVTLDERSVGVASLAATLGWPGVDDGPGVVVEGLDGLRAFRVSELVGRRDVVLAALPRVLPRVPLVVGAAAEADGSVLLVLDPGGLVRAALPAAAGAAPAVVAPVPVAREVLVVDDAAVVREMQRGILVRAGYRVRVAGDGRAALAAVAERVPDVVVTDIEMPELDGIALVRALRAQRHLASLPIVVLTSRGAAEDLRRGLDAGADAYLAKSTFESAALLDTVARLLGEDP